VCLTGDWSQTRFDKPNELLLNEDYSELLMENNFLRQDYREVLNYHLGGELALPGDAIFLRGGYAVYPSPLRNAPKDMDRIYYSGGIGVQVNQNVMLDVTLLRGTWSRNYEALGAVIVKTPSLQVVPWRILLKIVSSLVSVIISKI